MSENKIRKCSTCRCEKLESEYFSKNKKGELYKCCNQCLHKGKRNTSKSNRKDIFSLLGNIYAISWNEGDIKQVIQLTDHPEAYLSSPVHIALEKADKAQNKDLFMYILSKNKEVLKQHLKMTSSVFDYHFLHLI